MAGRAAHLELSIDVGSDPIQGLVAVKDGDPQPFCGWMELTAAIEAARERQARWPALGTGEEARRPLQKT